MARRRKRSNDADAPTDNGQVDSAAAIEPTVLPDVPPPDGVDNDPVLSVLDAVVNGIVHGSEVKNQQANIEKLISGQESRAELIDQLMLTHDYTRLLAFAKARAKLEQFMLACANRDDLSPMETLAISKYITDELKSLEGRVKAGSTSVGDFMQLMSKIDYTVSLNQRELEKKLSTTTPQGREIIRRAAYKLGQLSKVED